MSFLADTQMEHVSGLADTAKKSFQPSNVISLHENHWYMYDREEDADSSPTYRGRGILGDFR